MGEQGAVLRPISVIAAWLISLPLWADLKAWQVAIHTVTSVVTLLLLALPENAGRRSDEAAQEKLNLLADALASLMDARADDDPQPARGGDAPARGRRPGGTPLAPFGAIASNLAPAAQGRSPTPP